MADKFVFILFMLIGALSVAASVFNFEWFFKTNGAATFIRILGYKGARIFYGILGILLIGVGLSFWFDLLT